MRSAICWLTRGFAGRRPNNDKPEVTGCWSALADDFRTFLLLAFIVIELKVPLPENGKGTDWHLFARLLRCGRVGTHAVERRGPVGIALCSTSTAGFPALHLSATFRHGPLVAPGLESAVL